VAGVENRAMGLMHNQAMNNGRGDFLAMLMVRKMLA
jgi:hypothetical protein